jgi:hypothetical protein
MKYLVLLGALLPALASAESFKMCKGEFALCAASGATLTGKTITVNGNAFPEVVAVCPVLHGPAIADVAGGNMQGSCNPPGKNQVWSLYQVRKNIPQAPDWKHDTIAPYRTFVSSQTAQMSNLFSFSCTKSTVVNGQQLANCYGPANENLSGAVVPVGTEIITQAPVGVTYPVGGPLPSEGK